MTGRQPWIAVYSITGRGIDIILSLNMQQKCIHSLIVVENSRFFNERIMMATIQEDENSITSRRRAHYRDPHFGNRWSNPNMYL
jgi:hypothetical protein